MATVLKWQYAQAANSKQFQSHASHQVVRFLLVKVSCHQCSHLVATCIADTQTHKEMDVMEGIQRRGDNSPTHNGPLSQRADAQAADTFPPPRVS